MLLSSVSARVRYDPLTESVVWTVAVILSRRSDAAEGGVAQDGEGSQATAMPAENPRGIQRNLGGLRSFAVLRRLRLRLRAYGSLRMTNVRMAAVSVFAYAV